MYKSFLIVSFIVLIVRIIGFIREIAFAHVFGVSIFTDAFNVSFRIINLICRIFSEDIFSQTFIPIYIEYKNKKKFSFLKLKKIVNDITTILLWVSFIIVILGSIFSLSIVKVILSKKNKSNELFNLSSTLVRIMLPFIYCSSYIAISRCIFNIYKKIKISSISLIILNILFIFSVYFISPLFNCPIYGVGFFIFISGIIQILLQVPFLIKVGILPKIYLNIISSLKNKRAVYIYKKMLAPVMSYAFLQVNMLLNIKISSSLKSGSVSWLFYSDRLIEFPLALISGILYVIILPILSEAFIKKDNSEYYVFFDYSLRMIFLLIFPLQVCFSIFSIPIVSTLFFYNKFDIYSVMMTSHALIFYSFGLIAFLINKVFLLNFFIKKDSKMPIKFSLFIVTISQIINFILVPHLGYAGLSLSTSITTILSAFYLFFVFASDKKVHFQSGWLVFFIKIIISSLIMLVFGLFLSKFFNWFEVHHPIKRIISLIILFIFSFSIYLISLFLIKFDFSFLEKILEVKKNIK